jgi:hypothetical protein
MVLHLLRPARQGEGEVPLKARRVGALRAMLACDRPVEEALDPLPHPAGGLRLRQPNRIEDCEDVLRADLRDRQVEQARRVLLEAVTPLLGVLVVRPFDAVLIEEQVERLPEGQEVLSGFGSFAGWGLPPRAALRQRVRPCPRLQANLRSAGAGLLKGDLGVAAQADLTADTVRLNSSAA